MGEPDTDSAELPPSPFDLDPSGLQCPYLHYEALRAQEPAAWVDDIEAHFVSSYDDVTRLLRAPEIASSRMPTGPRLAEHTSSLIRRSIADGSIPSGAARLLENPPPHTVFRLDPPEHTQMRKLVSRILTPRRARGFEPMVRAQAIELARNLGRVGHGDAVALFARPLPERVILPLLRMPDDMVDDLRRWTSATTHIIGNTHATDDEIFEMMGARANMTEFFGDLLEEVRADPADDLVTALIEARDSDGNTLSEGERIGLLINLLVAGNETSIKATSAAVGLLATRPDLWRQLKADPELVPTFVEEVLRLEPPTQGMFRYLTEDVEVGDRVLEGGTHVFLSFAAANRDPETFGDPSMVDLERADASRHLSFGHGPHTCLGAWLARLEINVAVESLLAELSALELAQNAAFSYEPSFLLHGLEELYVDATPV